MENSYAVYEKKDNSKLVIGAIFIILGMVLIIIGLFFLITNLNFANNSTLVTGTISDNYIKFNTNNFKEVKVTSGYINIVTKFAKSSNVDLIYNPSNPQDAKINSFNSLWTIPGLILIMGLITIFAGIYTVVKN